jgi:hypothetical protein
MQRAFDPGTGTSLQHRCGETEQSNDKAAAHKTRYSDITLTRSRVLLAMPQAPSARGDATPRISIKR